jgi:acetyl/propionyl-CoA carboxylase alpha subunit
MPLYAEDPAHDFRPATGTILNWKPPGGPGVRVDAGVREGGEVTAAFDPMIAKIICHGATRAQAIARRCALRWNRAARDVKTNSALPDARFSPTRCSNRGDFRHRHD